MRACCHHTWLLASVGTSDAPAMPPRHTDHDTTRPHAALRPQLADQAKNMAAMQAEAAKLIQTARHKTGRLLKQNAVQRLEEARGFSTQTPNSALTRKSTTSTSSPSTTKKL